MGDKQGESLRLIHWHLRELVDLAGIIIVVESFCKDLTDVLAAKLGYSEQKLWETVNAHRADYRAKARRWKDEVGLLDIGAGRIVVGALAAKASPEKSDLRNALDEALKDLSILNKYSHHREDCALDWDHDRRAVGASIWNLLNAATALVAEMPWHFTTIQRAGSQPSVVTGKAWSHSHPEERIMRVLQWSGNQIGSRALIWNPTLTNPIVTDPRILGRP